MHAALSTPYVQYMRDMLSMTAEDRQRATRLLNAATSYALQKAFEIGSYTLESEEQVFAGYLVTDRGSDGTPILYELKRNSEDKGAMAMLDLSHAEDEDKLGELIARGYTEVTPW